MAAIENKYNDILQGDTRNQETGGLTRSYHQLTVVNYLILLAFRHFETKLGVIILPLAVAGSNESMWI